MSGWGSPAAAFFFNSFNSISARFAGDKPASCSLMFSALVTTLVVPRLFLKVPRPMPAGRRLQVAPSSGPARADHLYLFPALVVPGLLHLTGSQVRPAAMPVLHRLRLRFAVRRSARPASRWSATETHRPDSTPRPTAVAEWK